MDFTRQSTSHWLLCICSLLLQEWGLEGYQLWLVCSQTQEDDSGLYETINQSQLIQLQFVKSALTVNPCMVCRIHYFNIFSSLLI